MPSFPNLFSILNNSPILHCAAKPQISVLGKTRRPRIKSLCTSLTDPQKPVHIIEYYMLLRKALSLESFMKIKSFVGCSPATEVFLPGKKESQTFCSASRTSCIFTNYLTVHVSSLFLKNFTAIMCSYFPDFSISLFKHRNPKWT